MTPTDPFLVAKLSARAPRHDPLACTREPCARCRPPQRPTPPHPVNHRVARHVDRSPNPLTPLVPLLRFHAPHVEAKLGKAMRDLADGIRDHGAERWRRLLDWEQRTLPYGISLTRQEPDVDDDTGPRTPRISITDEKLRAEEAHVSGYAQDARTTAAQLPTTLAALPTTEAHTHHLVYRLRFLVAVAETRRPRRLGTREQTAAQVAADGWCRSCYRVGVFEPITRRDGGKGDPFYADLCRWCGSHRGTLHQPPVDMLRLHHRIPTRKKTA